MLEEVCFLHDSQKQNAPQSLDKLAVFHRLIICSFIMKLKHLYWNGHNIYSVDNFFFFKKQLENLNFYEHTV